MEFVIGIIDFILHVDKHLVEIIRNYGSWTYLIVFVIIFGETGLVVTPFLPGDSLLFVLGALGATGALDFKLTLILLIIAAFSGNTVNYFVGVLIGDKVLKAKNSRLIKREYLEKTQAFYEKHGGKAIILSRFLPIFRTFAPFVAGIGKMPIAKFLLYNLVGGLSWIILFLSGGYYFGNIAIIKQNFTLVIFLIIIVSIMPAIITFLKSRVKKS